MSNGRGDWHGYYFTAYGIAVKHGFTGTEEEWLESLRGERGPGAKLRYDLDRDVLEWTFEGQEDDWQELLDINDLRGYVVSATLDQAQQARDQAQEAQTAAEAARAGTENAQKLAQTWADGAKAQAEAAERSAASAQNAWNRTQDASREAENARVGAVQAQNAADAARRRAESAGDDAQAAAAQAEETAEGVSLAKDEAQAAHRGAVAAQEAAQTARLLAEAAAGTAAEKTVGIMAERAAEVAQNAAEAAAALGAKIIRDAVHEDAERAEAARTAAETAQGAAETARDGAVTAQTSAETAQGVAETARDSAVAAQASAETAQGVAETACDSAVTAQASAETAQGAAEAARDGAVTAQTSAETAQGAAEAARDGAVTAQTSAETAQSAAEVARDGAAQACAAAKSWAVGGTGIREGEDVDNAKYWCENARAVAGGGVLSFRGRSGDVQPQTGDYSAEMVGADPAGTAETTVTAHSGDGAAHETLFSAKQPLLAGQPGQVVGFDDSGNAVAQEPAISASQASYDSSESGLTADTVQAALDALTASKADVGRVSNSSLLINGYLADPINQKGETSYSEGGYTIDMWFASAGLIVSLEDGWLKLHNPSAVDKYILQKLEPKTISGVAGNNVTASLLYKIAGSNSPFSTRYVENGAYVNILVGTMPDSAGQASVCAVTSGAAIPSDVKSVWQLLIQVRAGATIYLKAAKLELGPQQTLAYQDADGNWVLNDPPPNKALELVKCQRYQQVLNPGFTCRATVITSGAITFLIPTPVTFRAYPEIAGSGSLIVRKTSAENQSGFSFSTTSSGSGYIRITAIKENHGMTDAELFVTGGPIILDANL